MDNKLFKIYLKGLSKNKLINHLLDYAYIGNLPKVKYLVELGADIHVCKNEAVRYAAERGHLHILKFLVEQGADIYERNDAAFRLSDIHEIREYLLYFTKRARHTEIVDYINSLPE